MATWTASFDRYVNLIVTATESSVNTANNTSVVTVTAKLRYHTGSTSTFNNYPQTLTVSINGVSKQGKTNQTYYLSASSREKSLGSWTETVTHNSNGSKSVSINVSYKATNGDGATVNKTMALTTIPRASKPFLNKTTVPLGSSVELHFGRADPSFTHSVSFGFGSKRFSLADKTTDGMITWTPTASQQSEIASQIPNATSGWGGFDVTTYSGNTKIGSTSTVKLTITIPNDSTSAPSATTPTFEEQTSSVISLNHGVIQGKSVIKLSSVISTKLHSTISRVQFKIGGMTYNASVSGNTATYNYAVSSHGNFDVRAIVTDSRGRKRESPALTINSSAYSPPSLRLSASRKKPPNDEQVEVSLDSTFTSLGSKNLTTLALQIRVSGGSWSGNLMTTKNNATGSIKIATTENINYTVSRTQAYEVRATIKDKLSDAIQSTVTISTGKALFDAYKDVGISIGKMYDESNPIELQVDGSVEFNGSLKLTGEGQDTRFTIDPVIGNASIELGSMQVESTPYIDFHSSGTGSDYDARIIAKNGDSRNGEGDLSIDAKTVRINNDEIVSYGNNKNGHWIRFYNGVQICFGRDEGGKNVNIANGQVFRSNTFSYDYPAKFSGVMVPIVTVTATDAWTAKMTKIPWTGFSVMLYKGTSANTLDTDISWTAIGRWR